MKKVHHDEAEVQPFFNFINNEHPNINFAIENEIDAQLNFPDVMIKCDTNNLFSSTSYKKTYTGLLTNFDSFISFSYK